MYIQSYLEKENGTAVIQVVMTAEELDRAVHEEYEKKKDQYEIVTQKCEKTILTAIQETNDALYSMKTAENIKSVVDDRLNNDEKEMKYTIIREDAGTADNLDILIQEQKLIISKMQTVSAKINEIISAINLYQALGGVDFTVIENI